MGEASEAAVGEALRGRTVRWYRAPVGRAAARVLAPAALSLLAGSLLVTHGLLAPDPHRAWLGLLGLGLVVAGPLGAIAGLLRLLSRDDVLLVRADGLERRGPAERWQEPFEALEAIVPGAEGTVLLRRRDGSHRELAAERLRPGEAAALAAELERLRQKALWGLL